MTAGEVMKQYEWCQGSVAIDSLGFPCSASSKDVVSLCALGALGKAYPDGSWDKMGGAGDKLKRHLNIVSIGCWNDRPERTKEEVVAALCGAGV